MTGVNIGLYKFVQGGPSRPHLTQADAHPSYEPNVPPFSKYVLFTLFALLRNVRLIAYIFGKHHIYIQIHTYNHVLPLRTPNYSRQAIINTLAHIHLQGALCRIQTPAVMQNVDSRSVLGFSASRLAVGSKKLEHPKSL